MDSGPQQATAVIRDGDPSQARPNNTEVQVDTADVANKSEATSKGKDPTNDPDKKKKKKGKKRQSAANKLKKEKNKKKRSIVTDSSSDSSDDDTDASDSDTDDTEAEVVPPRKRATKKGHETRKDKTANRFKEFVRNTAATQSGSDTSVSDTESEVEVRNDDPLAKSDKVKNHIPNQDLSLAIARELQRLLQLAQTQAPPSMGIPGQIGGLGSNLGGGLDAGLGGGLSTLNYPQAGGRAGFGTWPSLAAGRNHTGRGQGARAAGLDNLHDPLVDGLGIDPVAARRARRLDAIRGDKKLPDGSIDKRQKSKKLDYKRVDQVWDNTIHNFKLQDTAESANETKYDGFCFHVRRTFDWEGKYKATVVDIKSKILRESLQDVIGNIKGVSLVDETPKLDPNVLFL